VAGRLSCFPIVSTSLAAALSGYGITIGQAYPQAGVRVGGVVRGIKKETRPEAMSQIVLFYGIVVIVYRVRRKAPDFSRGDIRHIAPCGADCCARMRWFLVFWLSCATKYTIMYMRRISGCEQKSLSGVKCKRYGYRDP